MDGEEIMEMQETTAADGFLDGWESEETAAEASEGSAPETAAEPSPEAGEEPEHQKEAEPPAEAPESAAAPQIPEEAPSETPPPAPRTWTLTHQGQPLTVNEQDLTALAQKGLEFARVQREYDEGRPILDLLGRFAAQAGMTLPEYARQLRAQAKQAEGLSPEEARRQLEVEDREAALAEKEAQERARQAAAAQLQQRRQALEAKRDADIREFTQVFPQAAADPGSIPREVWADVGRGLSLTAAYARYAQARAWAEQAETEEAARRQEAARARNAENAARAVGSLKSAGGDGPRDPFLEGWEDA